jgi:hypothetical protein
MPSIRSEPLMTASALRHDRAVWHDRIDRRTRADDAALVMIAR